MKKTLLTLLMVFSIIIITTKSVYAEKILSPNLQGDSKQVAFSDLGYSELTLHTPFDSAAVRITVPSDWNLSPGGEIVLNYNVLLDGSDVAEVNGIKKANVGTVSVLFNSQVVGTIFISESGSFSLPITLPSSSLSSTRDDGRHELEFSLLASESCIYDFRASIIIKSDSYFNLSFDKIAPDLDLARLPYPFSPTSAFSPGKTLLVIPDNPDEKELEAALNFSSGFGSLVDSGFSMQALSASQASLDKLTEGNIVFVGQPNDFPMLIDVQLPVPFSSEGFENMQLNSEDGVVQLAHSPWSTGKAIMLVSGNTSDAVNIAAQAVSTGQLFAAINSRYVIVSGINSYVESSIAVEKFTLLDLGYINRTFGKVGLSSESYLFFIPKEQVNSRGAYLDLSYGTGQFGDDRNVTLSVFVNGSIVAAISLTNSEENIMTKRIEIPQGLLKFGENSLRIEAEIIPNSACNINRLQNDFITIFSDSTITIPVGPPQLLNPDLSTDFRFFPEIVQRTSDMRDVAFVLPQNDPVAWATANQIAMFLGRTGNPSLSSLEVSFADQVPQALLEEHNLIFVGKANTLPMLQEINEILPAPFDLGSNNASEGSLQVSYRVPEGTSLGYLEILNSPFADNKVVLVVAGNSDEGVKFAGTALTAPELRSKLSGRFAVTSGVQVAVSNIKAISGSGSGFESIVVDVAPESEKVVNTPIPVGVNNASANLSRPFWLVPLFIVSGILVLVLVFSNYIKAKKG